MSVYVLSPSDFGAIAATLRTAKGCYGQAIFPLSSFERCEQIELDHRPEDEYRASLIEPFVFRLYLANVMAYEYTYWKAGQATFEIHLIDLPKSRPLGLPELLKLLESLAYNIISNGGNSFLGTKDQQKLDQIMTRLQRAIIRRAD